MSGKLFLLSIIICVLLCPVFVVPVEADSLTWNQTYGGDGYDRAYAMVNTTDGGYALAGYTESFGAGGADFWLVKTDEFGEEEWSKYYGWIDYDEAHSLVATSDGGYAIAGCTASYGNLRDNFWLIKTDEYGIPEYSSWLIPSALLAATAIILIYKKRLSNQRTQQ